MAENDVVVIAERVVGGHPDVTFELLGKAKEIASALGGEVHCLVLGDTEGYECLGASDHLHLVEGEHLWPYNAHAWESAISALLAQLKPRLVLASTGTVGIDLCGALAAQSGAMLASYVVDLSVEGGSLTAVAQLYGGKLMAECDLGDGPAFVTAIPGSFAEQAARVDGVADATSHSHDGADVRMRHVALTEPEKSGVDITSEEMLVSVGRGIGSQSNIDLAQELAELLGAGLSASRPVIDQGWLPKAHQVGKSGKKVKPKIYLALGISGAPEHLEGMRQAELIIACNTDATAPIFEVAHYGTTADLFDLVPEILDLIGG